MNECLHSTAKTDSEASLNASTEEENRLLNSPMRSTMDMTDMKYALGTPPGGWVGTPPSLANPSRPTMDLTDMKKALDTPQGGRPGTYNRFG